MTLNDYFVLVCLGLFGSVSNALTCSDFHTKLFRNLQSYEYTSQQQKSSAAILVSGDVRFIGLFTGVP